MVDCATCGAKTTSKKYCSRRCYFERPMSKHGFAANGRTREYITWQHMRRRCRELPRYTQLGMFDLWNDPVKFITYVIENLGPHPGRGWSIDRIDNDRGYFPGNIRWATAKMQSHNHPQVNQWTRSAA